MAASASRAAARFACGESLAIVSGFFDFPGAARLRRLPPGRRAEPKKTSPSAPAEPWTAGEPSCAKTAKFSAAASATAPPTPPFDA